MDYLIASLVVAAASHAERHALLIGVGDYAYDGFTDLEGPENDVLALRSLLTERWGYRAENVRTLESREATRARILVEVRGLNRAERLILVLYYYEELTMKEIGATLDLSESRVSQMHSSVMSRLKAQLERRRQELTQTA